MAGQRADQLSGGQSQRVAIARALMQRPEIVLADEPAASLDPQAGDEVMQLFASLMREEAKTVVFTSHNLSPRTVIRRPRDRHRRRQDRARFALLQPAGKRTPGPLCLIMCFRPG